MDDWGITTVLLLPIITGMNCLGVSLELHSYTTVFAWDYLNSSSQSLVSKGNTTIFFSWNKALKSLISDL